MTSIRYVAHEPDMMDGDPHVYDAIMGEVVEALDTMEQAIGRAGELNADSSTDPRFNVDDFRLEGPSGSSGGDRL